LLQNEGIGDKMTYMKTETRVYSFNGRSFKTEERAERDDNRYNLAFILSMPYAASWDGKWSGEGEPYVRVFTLPAKKVEWAQKLIGSHTWRFSDGWIAAVDVKRVTDSEKRKLQRESKGFCGYDWMIDSILEFGEIKLKERK
jgi:hypothetical protein